MPQAGTVYQNASPRPQMLSIFESGWGKKKRKGSPIIHTQLREQMLLSDCQRALERKGKGRTGVLTHLC